MRWDEKYNEWVKDRLGFAEKKDSWTWGHTNRNYPKWNTKSKNIGEKMNSSLVSCRTTYSTLICNYNSGARRKENNGLKFSEFFEKK